MRSNFLTTSAMNKPAALITACLIAVLSHPAAAQQGTAKFAVGQRVEAFNVAWYKATVVEIGGGANAGYIKVRYDGFSSEQYLKESSIRIPKAATVGNTAAGPRSGRYTIQSYGNVYNPIILGYFDLKAGRYTYYDAGENLIGTGAYSFDAASQKVSWESGPLRVFGGTADFKISREGKTHSIGLKPRFGTAASNSTDSK